MDEAVSRLRSASTLLLPLLAMLACGNARAQALSDPTRPPANLLAPAGVASVPVSSAPRVQSILIARQTGGRHVAVIDGQTVRLGENFRGARLERMTETEVTLVKGNERQVLRLFPASPAAK